MTKTKERILDNLLHTYCRLMPSPIEGVGVFAITDIPEGVNPFQGARDPAWHRFTPAELATLGPEQRALLDHFFAGNEDGTVYIADTGITGIDMSYYLNNAEQPNVRTTDGGQHFATLRPVKKGEELTVSYATFDDAWDAHHDTNHERP